MTSPSTYAKTFIPLESNPEVLTSLAHTLGVSPTLAFHDLYSLHERDLISIIPSPLALLFIYPRTTTSDSFTDSSKAASATSTYTGSGPGEPIIFFRQTIENACGLIGLLHCVTNNSSYITPDSNLDKLLNQAIPLQVEERAQLLVESPELEAAHASHAQLGSTTAPPLYEAPGHSFIAFVKGKDGCLWELPGPDWKKPVNRGKVDGDVLSEEALELGPRTYVKREFEGNGKGGSLNFHCLVLAPVLD